MFVISPLKALRKRTVLIVAYSLAQDALRLAQANIALVPLLSVSSQTSVEHIHTLGPIFVTTDRLHIQHAPY